MTEVDSRSTDDVPESKKLRNPADLVTMCPHCRIESDDKGYYRVKCETCTSWDDFKPKYEHLADSDLLLNFRLHPTKWNTKTLERLSSLTDQEWIILLDLCELSDEAKARGIGRVVSYLDQKELEQQIKLELEDRKRCHWIYVNSPNQERCVEPVEGRSRYCAHHRRAVALQKLAERYERFREKHPEEANRKR